MVAQNELMRIFWPSDVTKTNLPGVLVGFKSSALDFFVVSVLVEVEVRAVY